MYLDIPRGMKVRQSSARLPIETFVRQSYFDNVRKLCSLKRTPNNRAIGDGVFIDYPQHCYRLNQPVANSYNIITRHTRIQAAQMCKCRCQILNATIRIRLYGLPATGYFGPLTRAALASMSTTSAAH